MNKNNKNQGQNKELIYLGAIISTSDPMTVLNNINIDYFTNDKIIEILNLCIDENKILPVSDKLFTRAKIQYEKFITGKTDDEIKEALKKIKNELYLNTEEGIRHNCVFSDLFDERLAVEVDEQYVTTGIEPFDHYLTGGLMKKTLTGIQAATGQGKTTMLLTLGCNILKKGYNVCFVNLEMNENEFNNNILSGLSDKFSYSDIKMNNNLKNPNFRKELQEEIKSKNIGKTCLIINRTGEYEAMSPKLIEKWILQEEERKAIKFDVVLIDYLFLLKTASKNNYTQQTFEFLQKVTQEAHMMSQNNNWAVLSVFQENREGAKNTDKSGTEGMAGSYNSLHDMDNYFKFHQSKSKDDLIIVNPLKLRQYGGLKNGEGPFTMKYTKIKKIYELTNEIAKECVSDYSWKDIYALPEVHEQLSSKDIKELLKSIGCTDIPISFDAGISKEKGKHNYKTVKTSVTDWKSIESNIENIILKYQQKPKVYSTTDLMNDDPQKLFDM